MFSLPLNIFQVSPGSLFHVYDKNTVHIIWNGLVSKKDIRLRRQEAMQYDLENIPPYFFFE